MEELYVLIVEKGGLFGIICVVIVIVLSLFIKSIKTSQLSSYDSHSIWLYLLRFLKIFFIISTILFFIIKLIEVVDNSKFIKNFFKPEIIEVPSAKDSMVLVDNSNPLAFVDTNVTTFSLPSNRITLSKQFDFVLDSANTIRIIKKGNSIWLPAYESNYLLIPIVDIESFIYVINSYKRGILEIKYKNSIPSTCIQIDKNFNETEFSLYFKYGIQKYNSTISLQKKQSKDWIVYVITVLLSGLMIFYLTRSFIRLFK